MRLNPINKNANINANQQTLKNTILGTSEEGVGKRWFNHHHIYAQTILPIIILKNVSNFLRKLI